MSRFKNNVIIRAGLFTAVGLFLIGALEPARGQTIYNGIPNPLPPNVLSVGLEATGAREVGDGLVFTPGTGRHVSTVSVVLSSFACTSGMWNIALPSPNACVTTPPNATFPQPVTLNIYTVNPPTTCNPVCVPPLPEPGMLIATSTMTFNIRYRPSSDAVHCGVNTGGDGEEWFDVTTLTCNHGLAQIITFDLSSLNLTLPDEVIATVTWNTSTSGYQPLGKNNPCNMSTAGCTYDLLNVSTDGNPTIGRNVDPNGIYVNWQDPANSCTGTTSGALLLDTPCWTDSHVEFQVNTGFSIGETFQVRYASNLNIGDSFINITNTGASTAAGIAGNLCVNVYTFDQSEELLACCSCFVTPNGLQAISVKHSLISNTLTPEIPNSVVVKLLATAAGATGASCNASAPTFGTLAPGMRAWGTTLHAKPTTPVTYGITETPFITSDLSPGELNHITNFCGFIQSNASGFGICNGCTTGGLGATTAR